MKHFSVIFFLMLMCQCTIRTHAQEETVVNKDVYPIKYNMVSLHPLAAMDIGIGVGAGYERIFGAKHNFGLVLPVFIVFDNKTAAESTNVTNNNESGNKFDNYFYFAPGFKFYPSGHNKITYAVGPSFIFGFANSKFDVVSLDNYGQETIATVKYARKRFGVLINNYVSYDIAKSLYIGLDGGIGLSYFDKASYSGAESYAGLGSIRKGVDVAGQFSFSIGYKF